MSQATFRLLASTTHLGSVRVKTLVTSRIFKEHRAGFSAKRFQKCVHYPRGAGGASRDRTGDPLLAKQVLSQLSYGPNGVFARRRHEWWVWEDSNHRPHPYQGCALTT